MEPNISSEMHRKQAIITALRAFIKQRPGLEFGNYGDRTSYNSELRSIARDKRDAERLLDAVENIDDITADDLIAASKSAFSGRLTLKQEESCKKEGCHYGEIIAASTTEVSRPCPNKDGHAWRIDYCTGQYWPTEYRKAVAAVCASALWDSQRNELTEMEAKGGPNLERLKDGNRYYYEPSGKFLNAGDWLRTSFRHWFGRSIQQRWFN